VRMLLDTLHDQIYVPAAAIQHGAQGTYVYAIDKSLTANMRTVKTGATDGDKIAITDGLSPGEMVVVDGADRLKDGASVTLPGQKGAYVIPAASAHGKWKGKHGAHHHHHQSGGDGGGQ